MKTKQLFLKLFLLVGFFSMGIFKPVNAQQRNLKNEILVYILPDSLEMPNNEKSKINYTDAKVSSKSLALVLAKIKPLAISKTFPDWNKADSI
jgi:hypothetical protein